MNVPALIQITISVNKALNHKSHLMKTMFLSQRRKFSWYKPWKMNKKKLPSQIRTLGEGEMKEKLLETFLSTIHKNQGYSSKNASKTEPKALFIDASFERNRTCFQRSEQKLGL